MATIVGRKRKDGKTVYQVRIRVQGRKSESRTFSSRVRAKRWAQQEEPDIRDGRHIQSRESRKHTLSELIDRYFVEVLPERKDVRNPKRQLEWWRDRLGHLLLSDLTPARIVEARGALLTEKTDWSKSKRKSGGKRAPATVARYLAVLSHAISTAVREWQWMEDNPAQKISKPKEGPGRDRYLDDAERTEFLKACNNSGHPFLYTAVVLALSTGARKAELMGLRWKDVDLRAGRIYLYHTKNGDRRSLPLRGRALELIRGLFANRNIGTDLVFPGRRHLNKPIDLSTPFLAALQKAGIENFRWHDLRHSAASYLAMNGATVPEIAAALGHRDFSMAKRYAHLSSQHVESVVERMNERIFADSI